MNSPLVVSFFIVIAIAAVLFSRGVTPNASEMAVSVSDDLTVASAVSPFDPRRADQVLAEIYAQRLALNGEPPLNGFVRQRLLPEVIAVASPNGTLLAGRER